MYRVMLVFESQRILRELLNLNVWENESGYRVHTVCRDTTTALEKASSIQFDLIFVEPDMENGAGCTLLEILRNRNLCDDVIFCGDKANFEYAVQGIRGRAFDYFILPYKKSDFLKIFQEIDRLHSLRNEHEAYRVREIVRYFRKRDNGLFDYLKEMFDRIALRHSNDGKIPEVCTSIVHGVFSSIKAEAQWISQYYEAPEMIHNNEHAYSELAELFSIYTELYPDIQDTRIDKIRLYILNNPEQDIRLLKVADKFGISDSGLCTQFNCVLGIGYSDYITLTKMTRASRLIISTNDSVMEIAEKLRYKDAGYFSRLFREMYGMSPQAYRKTKRIEEI